MKVYVVLDQTSDEEKDIFEAIYKDDKKAVERCIEIVTVKGGNRVNADTLVAKRVDRYSPNYAVDYGYKDETFFGGVNWCCTLLEYEVM